MTEHDTHEQQLYEELSAYLDGELDAESVRAVEERLVREPAYRAELQRLERAWNLLDGLPRATVNESFVRTTIEMVAVAASDEAVAAQVAAPRRRRVQRIVGLTGLAAAALGGFLAGRLLLADPNEQLLKDLPVLENFEFYYQADNIDFSSIAGTGRPVCRRRGRSCRLSAAKNRRRDSAPLRGRRACGGWRSSFPFRSLLVRCPGCRLGRVR